MFRRAAFVLLASFFVTTSAVGQRPSNDLVVKVTYDSGRAVAEQTRVQLLGGSGVPQAELNTRGQGEVRFHGVGYGTFRIRVSGPDIEEKTSESFNIDPRDNTHMEFVTVTRKPGAETSAQGSISASQLNIPDRAASEFEKGMKALKKREMDEAEKRFSKATELYPQYAAAISHLGVIAMQRGKLQEGQEFFVKALTVDPQYPPAYLNLAKIRIAEKKYDEAVRLLTKATALEPAGGETLALLTMVEYESNRLPDAVAHARQVHSLPDHGKYAFTHYIAGKALEAQQRPTDAMVEYRLFLKEAPESATTAKAKAALAALETASR
ncbi:MAG: tetratricopeptide repeat protein [Terriglobales bacterium]